MPGHCLRTSFAANIATGDHGHAHAPTLSPSPSSSPVLAWGVGCRSLVSQSVSQSFRPSRQQSMLTTRTRLRPHCLLFTSILGSREWTMQLGLGLECLQTGQLVLYPTRSAVACQEKKELPSVQYRLVLYTSTVVTGWSVGGSSPVQHQKESSYGRNTGRHPLSDPAKKASPGTRETLSARTVAQQTRAACSNGTYMHLCTSTRLTKCIVSSRYQIAYRGLQSTSSRVKFANLSFSFPTAQHVSTPVRGSGHLSVSVAAVGFSTPTRLSSFLVPARSRRPPIAKKARLGSTG